jgi:hypothetical protein
VTNTPRWILASHDASVCGYPAQPDQEGSIPILFNEFGTLLINTEFLRPGFADFRIEHARARLLDGSADLGWNDAVKRPTGKETR